MRWPMRRWFSVALAVVAATLPFAWANDKPNVTYESPNKCTGHHGAWGWTDTQFPFTLAEHGKDLKLKEKPVIRVVGKAFYDAEHASKKVPNRREKAPRLTVWEIHPVMRLKVLPKNE